MGEGGFRRFPASEMKRIIPTMSGSAPQPSRTYDFGSGFGEVALIAGRLYRY
jgi:hypothetical protein